MLISQENIRILSVKEWYTQFSRNRTWPRHKNNNLRIRRHDNNNTVTHNPSGWYCLQFSRAGDSHMKTTRLLVEKFWMWPIWAWIGLYLASKRFFLKPKLANSSLKWNYEHFFHDCFFECILNETRILQIYTSTSISYRSPPRCSYLAQSKLR